MDGAQAGCSKAPGHHRFCLCSASPVSPGLPGPWLPGFPGHVWFQGRAPTRASSPEPCLCCDLEGDPGQLCSHCAGPGL